VRVGVIANGVSSGGDATRDIRLGGYVLADKEERRFHVVLGEHVKKMQRVRIVGAVVVGERELLGVGEAVERPAEQLGLGRNGAIAGGTSGS